MLDNFNTKGYVEGGIITNDRNESLDIAALPPIVRTLLVTDGTVTKTLEAYFWEPIQVEQMGQRVAPLDKDIKQMGLSAGDDVLLRDVSISGTRSGDVYAYATSVLNISHLPEDVRNQLIAGTIGIGELLRDKGLETYRQVIDMYRELKTEVIPGSKGQYCGELICRTYLIHIDNDPVIQVTEKFPYRLYQNKH